MSVFFSLHWKEKMDSSVSMYICSIIVTSILCLALIITSILVFTMTAAVRGWMIWAIWNLIAISTGLQCTSNQKALDYFWSKFISHLFSAISWHITLYVYEFFKEREALVMRRRSKRKRAETKKSLSKKETTNFSAFQWTHFSLKKTLKNPIFAFKSTMERKLNWKITTYSLQ